MKSSFFPILLVFILAACGADAPTPTDDAANETPAANPGEQTAPKSRAIRADSILSAYQIGKPPTFPGDMPALQAYLKENGLILQMGMIRPDEVDILVQLVVEPDGSLTEFSIKKGKENPHSAKVIEVLKKSPKWNPGLRDGQPVRATLALPISAE